MSQVSMSQVSMSHSVVISVIFRPFRASFGWWSFIPEAYTPVCGISSLCGSDYLQTSEVVGMCKIDAKMMGGLRWCKIFIMVPIL